MSQSQPSPPPLPPPPAPAAPPPAPAPQVEIRIVPIPGGWIIYRGELPAAVASDPAALGATVAGLVKR